MALILNVYNGKNIEKTYTSEVYDITFGTVEDLINVLDIEKLLNGDNIQMVTAVALAIPKAFDTVKMLFKDMFDGLTDEELRKVKIIDLAAIIIDVIKYTMTQITDGKKEKN